jgi:hypothetical protein
MSETGQPNGDRHPILDARVTVYLDGLIITRFTEDKIGQAGILTTLEDHCLRILIRGKGQLGQIWPKRDSSGNIPHISYSSLKRMLALWLYVVPEKESQRPPGSAEQINDTIYTFKHVLDFAELHDNPQLKQNVLAPLKIPEGQFYMAQESEFFFWRGNAKPKQPLKKEYSSLIGVAIDYPLSKKGYLILKPELPSGSEEPEPSLLPARIPLERGARYEVIIQNAPIVESYPSDHSMHFKEFYAAFPYVDAKDRCNLKLVYPPEDPDRDALGPRAYPSSPPCTSAKYSGAGNFMWAPDGEDHH